MKASRLGKVLGLAGLASLAGWSANPASLLINRPADKNNPWVLDLADLNFALGKVKVLTMEPVYDDAGELVKDTLLYAELRGDQKNPEARKVALDPTHEKYWIIFFPKRGKINLSLFIYPKSVGNQNQGAKICVNEWIIKNSDKINGALEAVKKIPGIGDMFSQGQAVGEALMRVTQDGMKIVPSQLVPFIEGKTMFTKNFQAKVQRRAMPKDWCFSFL